MPLPASVQAGSGQLLIDASFSVLIEKPQDPRTRRAAELFLNHLRRQLGMSPLDMAIIDSGSAKLVLHAARAGKNIQELGEDESYSLQITSGGAKLDGATPLGILRGLETFRQLVENTSGGFAVPAVSIHDSPRFQWRGLMIDVSRHFEPLDVLKRNLDGMAAVKLNVFHWHLSDNQGFRVESKEFPKLAGMGSDGLFYTQDQVRDLIAYARDRGIRVVPEFDMPGHSTAWFVGYPELASGPGPYQVERKWGVFDPAMNPADERTYKFLDKFIGEMAQLFPDKYFHIGGDEVNGKEWDANPNIQAFMHAHGLKDNQDLQAYFNQRVQKIVSKHGKIMIGWDEVLHPDLPRDTVVQSWRGQDSLAQAAKQGYRGLLSYGYYLDLMWPALRHYAVDPMADAAAKLSPEEAQRILGGEACMWSEYVSPENLDSRIWPRMAAIAERLWSPQNVTDVNSMYDRLGATSHWLDWLGLTHNSSYEPMLRRVAGSDDASSLRVLADVVEPVKDYVREETAPVEPTSLVPLNRLVDAVRPESTVAREFAALVDEIIAHPDDRGARTQARDLLARWGTNQANLEPEESGSFLMKEVTSLSTSLSQVAGIGSQALDDIDRHQQASEQWRKESWTVLDAAKKPQAQLLLMIVPSVEKLLQAAAGQTASAIR
ncbi:MAG TPA: family 20 glycosylhydrolase [Terriglobales bacterium]|nr:family 20 glycosylhydrolase [Terriglobales bacterium]